jgi:hypothetical protein
MLIYTDLDNTLVNPVTDPEGNVTAILPRPGVQEFIDKLARDGQLWMLTAAVREHAERAMSILWPASKKFKGVLSREDMAPVEEQLGVVLEEPGLTDEERRNLYREIRPIAPPGAMFDNYPVGSSIYLLKAASIGIKPDQWIEVEHFGDGKMDRGGLKKAYTEFRRRFPFLLQMDGKRKRA